MSDIKYVVINPEDVTPFEEHAPTMQPRPLFLFDADGMVKQYCSQEQMDEFCEACPDVDEFYPDNILVFECADLDQAHSIVEMLKTYVPSITWKKDKRYSATLDVYV